MEKSKLMVISLLALTLCGCKEQYQYPYYWCVQEIKTNEGYEELEGYTYERVINEEQDFYHYSYKITTTTLNNDKTFDTVWFCNISFEPNFRTKFLQTLSYSSDRNEHKEAFEKSQISSIDCDILYTIQEEDYGK